MRRSLVLLLTCACAATLTWWAGQDDPGHRSVLNRGTGASARRAFSCDQSDAMARDDGEVVVTASAATADAALRIGGVVVDTFGEPIAGATVYWDYQGIPWIQALARYSEGGMTTTDRTGRFSIRAPNPGDYELTAFNPGYGHIGARVSRGDQEVRLTLARTGQVRGRVFMPDGQPGHPATVRAPGWDMVDTAPDGSFLLGAPFGGAVPICAEAEEQAEVYGVPVTVECRGEATATVARGSPPPEVTIRLRRGPVSTLPLRIVGPDDRPRAGYEVSCSISDLTGRELFADLDGRVRLFVPVPSGVTVRTSVRSPLDWVRGVETTTLPVDTGREIVVRLPAPVQFDVNVCGPSGEPLPAGVQADVSVLHGELVSSEANRVTLRVSGGQSQRFRIRAEGFCTAYREWEPALGDRFLVTLEPGASASGEIAWSDGDPARVRIQCGTASLESKQGRFHLDDLTPGRHTLLVFTTCAWFFSYGEIDVAWARREFVIRKGESLELAPLVLGAATVSGRVLGRDGGPVPGAQVTAVGKGLGRVGFAVADARGEFSVRVPGATSVRLVAWRRGTTAGISPVLSEGRDGIEIRLQPASTILVARSGPTVCTLDGFRLPVIEEWSYEHRAYRLEALPSGPLRLAWDEEEVLDVTVVPGRTSVVSLN